MTEQVIRSSWRASNIILFNSKKALNSKFVIQRSMRLTTPEKQAIVIQQSPPLLVTPKDPRQVYTTSQFVFGSAPLPRI